MDNGPGRRACLVSYTTVAAVLLRLAGGNWCAVAVETTKSNTFEGSTAVPPPSRMFN